MQHSIKTLIKSRVSTNYFDTDKPLPEELIEDLIGQATRAPSAYNFQNWKFIAVRSASAKARLHATAYGQQKVIDAPVTFIICGLLEAYQPLPELLAPSVNTGLFDQSVADGWVGMATRTHRDNPSLQRDEALRSASLAAMTLILAAEGMGLASCAMSGFDAEALAHAFDLAATEVPVILVTVGFAAAGNWTQKPRRPLMEVLSFA